MGQAFCGEIVDSLAVIHHEGLAEAGHAPGGFIAALKQMHIVMVIGIGSYFVTDDGGSADDFFLGEVFFDGFTGTVDDLPFAGLTEVLHQVFELGIGGVEGGHQCPECGVCVLNKFNDFVAHGTKGFLISVHGLWF